MARADANAVVAPNKGLYLGRPSISVPSGGLVDGNNFRIRDGKLTNLNVGYTEFESFGPLNGAVRLIDNFFLRSGAQILVFGTLKDLYQFNSGPKTVSFITPTYVTGTVDVTNGSAIVVGIGTSWLTNLKVGDEFHSGTSGQRDPNAIWYVIQTVDTDLQITLTTNYAEGTLSGQNYTGRKLFTMAKTDEWYPETFPKAAPDDEDKWFATNFIDFPVQWDGNDPEVTLLSSLLFKCKTLRRYKNMMLYVNLKLDTGEDRPYSFRHSVAGTPIDVTSAGSDEFVVHDGEDPLVEAVPLGDNIVFYAGRQGSFQGSVTLAQFVGDPLGFIFRSVADNVGPFAGKLIANHGNFHEFIAADGQHLFDGLALQQINQHVWREIIRTHDPARVSLGFTHFDDENLELIWAVAQTSDANLTDGTAEVGIVEHPLEQVGPRDPTPFSRRQFKATASGFFERTTALRWQDILTTWEATNFAWNDQFFAAAFPLNLMGDEDGQILQFGGQDFDGADIDSFAQTGRTAAGDTRRKGLIRRIYAFAEEFPSASYTLDVTIFTADSAAGALTNKGTFAYDITGGGERFVSPFVTGRFFETRYGTKLKNQPWTLQGWDVDASFAGER